MPRTIPPDALAAILAPETSEAFVHIISITPPGVFFTDNSVAVTQFAGLPEEQIYNPMPFNFVAPYNQEGQLTEARLVIDNVSRQLIDDIRNLSAPLNIDVSVIAVSAPDDVVASYPNAQLRNVSYDQLSISGSLVLENLQAENFSQLMTGKDYPALFFAR